MAIAVKVNRNNILTELVASELVGLGLGGFGEQNPGVVTLHPDQRLYS